MFNFMIDAYRQLSELTKANPVLAGIISLYGLALLAFFLKTTPKHIFKFIWSRITVKLTLTNASNQDSLRQQYNAFGMWFGQSHWARFSRSLSLIDVRDNGTDETDDHAYNGGYKPKIIPGYGYHFFVL